MRRLMFISAFALFLAVPLWAQRGGGHAGLGGGHSGGFTGHGLSSGHIGSHFSGGAAHTFSHGPSFTQRGFSRDPFLHNQFRGRFRNRAFRNNCFGCGVGIPWWGYDPWLWNWDSDSRYDDDYNNNLALANQMNEQSLEQQRMLRQEQADGDQDAYAPSSARSATNDEKQGSSILPPTLLVFRDQHRQEIQNYAIVGQTLWNFASQHTQKIPLADLDLTATAKANDDRGVTFRVPTANEAQ
jgi:hypothetical protein